MEPPDQAPGEWPVDPPRTAAELLPVLRALHPDLSEEALERLAEADAAYDRATWGERHDVYPLPEPGEDA